MPIAQVIRYCSEYWHKWVWVEKRKIVIVSLFFCCYFASCWVHSVQYWFCMLKNSMLECKRNKNNKPFERLENISSLQQGPVSGRGFQCSFCAFQSLTTFPPSVWKSTADLVHNSSCNMLPRSRTGLCSIQALGITTSLLWVLSLVQRKNSMHCWIYPKI